MKQNRGEMYGIILFDHLEILAPDDLRLKISGLRDTI